MTYLIKLACTVWRYVTWLITCLLHACSALYCELSAGLSCQAVSSGVAGYGCLPDGPSSTPPLLRLHEVRLVRAASWHVPPDSDILYVFLWRMFGFNLFQNWYTRCLRLYKPIPGTCMRKSGLCLYPHQLLWYNYPHSLFSWYRTVCMHYPILKLIFNRGILACFTSNIFRALHASWWSSQMISLYDLHHSNHLLDPEGSLQQSKWI